MIENNGLTCTVSRYLIQRLRDVGINHLFGVPGDYVLDFLDEVISSPIQWVGTCNELNAGYAADGYARLNGAGAAVVTYCVGGLSILNAVAGAFAERVPLIVISGAPPARRRNAGALVHHLVSDYYLQLDVFKKVTIDAAILIDPQTAPDEIDRVITNAIVHKLPVYLELPADMAHAPCRQPMARSTSVMPHSDEDSLKKSLQKAAELINSSKNPVLLAGIEALRFCHGGDLLHLVEAVEVPFATMLSSKSVLPELHPQFIGIYQGGWSREAVRQQVESSDCLLSLGAWMTDLDTGLFSEHLDSSRMIVATNGQVTIGDTKYLNVQLGDFIRELVTVVQPRSYLNSHPVVSHTIRSVFIPDETKKLSALRLYERLNTFLDDRMVLLAEPGDAFCAALDFNVEESENFIVQAYYSSIGYCTPAALGVSFACPDKRPVVLTGDGAFQMTAQEISTLIRQRCPAIILIINNDGYMVERVLHEDGPYNDIQMWNYADLPAAFGGGDYAVGIKVTTEGELERALVAASKEDGKFFMIELCLPDRDCSAGLKQLGDTFRQMVPVKQA
ncbi:MAG: alpha-keto acid decarboxylase family protein [Geobacteraceae bacterium]|nr:alpha-keto acid decarboxylase family protein [Geobacteraceae bacterium]